MDFLGSFLVVAAAVLVTFSFQNAGADETNVHPWREAVFIVPLVVGIVCWVAVFAWEFVSERLWPQRMPALPLVFVRNHVFAASTLNTIFLGFSYLATLFAVPLRLQVVNQKSAIMAGVMMLPMLGATGVGSALAGMMSKKQNRLFETMMVATISVTLGLALETTVSDSPELEPKFLGFLVFIGLGYGMVTASATIFSNIESPISEHGKSGFIHRIGYIMETNEALHQHRRKESLPRLECSGAALESPCHRRSWRLSNTHSSPGSSPPPSSGTWTPRH